MQVQTEALNTHNPAPAAEPLPLKSNEGLGPLPEYAHEFRPRWPGDDGGFTGAQMRVYATEAVAAERESIKARLLGMDDAAKGLHNYYAHAALVLFERA